MQYDSYSQEETHMVQAIVGANWGDEGKGKITDMLAEKADIIVRFQGGANAGHTIVYTSVRCILQPYDKHHWKWCCSGYTCFDK